MLILNANKTCRLNLLVRLKKILIIFNKYFFSLQQNTVEMFFCFAIFCKHVEIVFDNQMRSRKTPSKKVSIPFKKIF